MINYFLWIYILSGLFTFVVIYVIMSSKYDEDIDEESKIAASELKEYGNFVYILPLVPVLNTVIVISILVPLAGEYLLPKK